MPPFCSFLAQTILISVWGHSFWVAIFDRASLAFLTSLPSSRLLRWLVGASGDLSIRVCLFCAQIQASIPACVEGSCLLRASAYGVFVPFLYVSCAPWTSVCLVDLCRPSNALFMSPLACSRMEEISLDELSVALFISSLASSHVLYILSAGSRVCLVASLITSTACSDWSSSGLIRLMTDRAMNSAFWAVVSCSSRVATARMPLGSMLGGASEQGVGGCNSAKLGCPACPLEHSHASRGTPGLVLRWLVRLGLFLLVLLEL